jgi:hypothetical protein
MYSFGPSLTRMVPKEMENKYYFKSTRRLVTSLLSVDMKARLTLDEAMRFLKKLKDRWNGHCLTCDHHHHHE